MVNGDGCDADGVGRSTNFRCILSTPAVAIPYLQSEAELRKRHLSQIRYYQRYTQRLRDQGVNLSMTCATKLFDGDVLKDGMDDLEGRDCISQGELIQFLWKESINNFVKAKRCGKNNVRFDPIFIKFAIYLRAKVDTGTYRFMANVFNLPSDRTLSNYDTLDGQAKEGILHETLRQTENEFEQRSEKEGVLNPLHGEWLRAGILKFDEMKVREKLCFNPHTMELVGFVGGGIDNDVIKHEFKRLAKQHAEAEVVEENNVKDDGDESLRPDIAQHLLLFIFSTWDKERPVIKRAVARYAVGAKSTGSELACKIEKIICALYVRGFIVNMVASDGASENVAALKMLGTHSAKDVFVDLNPKLPSDVLVAFKHPSGCDRFVFLGGEMPHWIKWVNELEFSSKTSHK